jgi:putative endonuclease
VYILECADGTLYTGVTNDLDKRLRTHNAGKGARYTRSRLPVAVVSVITGLTKSEALKLEYQIKKKPRAKKIEALVAYERGSNLE